MGRGRLRSCACSREADDAAHFVMDSCREVAQACLPRNTELDPAQSRMSFLFQLIGGFLIVTGLPILASGLFLLSQPASDRDNREGAVGAMVFLGAWSTAGAFMVKAGRTSQRQQKEKKLLGLFFALIKQSKGRITPLAFAAASGLNGSEARQFLDARSGEFNGSFDVDLDGAVVYQFPIGEIPSADG